MLVKFLVKCPLWRGIALVPVQSASNALSGGLNDCTAATSRVARDHRAPQCFAAAAINQSRPESQVKSMTQGQAN